VTLRQPTETGGEVRLAGHLAPAVVGSSAHLAVYAGTSKADLKRIRTTPLIAGERSYATSVRLKPGRKWAVEVRYVDPGVLAVARSTRRTLVV
jgi:hypothetical protein